MSPALCQSNAIALPRETTILARLEAGEVRLDGFDSA